MQFNKIILYLKKILDYYDYKNILLSLTTI